jgi:hypothetical protein
VLALVTDQSAIAVHLRSQASALTADQLGPIVRFYFGSATCAPRNSALLVENRLVTKGGEVKIAEIFTRKVCRW